jgi:hypothetical protein
MGHNSNIYESFHPPTLIKQFYLFHNYRLFLYKMRTFFGHLKLAPIQPGNIVNSVQRLLDLTGLPTF